MAARSCEPLIFEVAWRSRQAAHRRESCLAVIRTFKAAGHHLDVNVIRVAAASIAFSQLLSDRSWPLDHFAGGDLIGT